MCRGRNPTQAAHFNCHPVDPTPKSWRRKGGTSQIKDTPGQTPPVTADVQARILSLCGVVVSLAWRYARLLRISTSITISATSAVTPGPGPTEAARAVKARAFTIGQDVVFGSGQYAPETKGRTAITCARADACSAAKAFFVTPRDPNDVQRQPAAAGRPPTQPMTRINELRPGG